MEELSSLFYEKVLDLAGPLANLATAELCSICWFPEPAVTAIGVKAFSSITGAQYLPPRKGDLNS